MAKGDGIVSGGDLKAIAELVGFEYDPPEILPPAVLMERWYEIIETAARMIRQIPSDKLSLTSPDRDRPLINLAYHAATIGRTFLRVYDEADGNERMPVDVTTAEQVAAVADRTRQLVETWWTEIGVHDPLDRVVESYQGIQTLLEYLERETWHTAQHTRQITMFLEQFGITPDRPLRPETIAGLPMPERIWD